MKEIYIWLQILNDSGKWEITQVDNHITLVYKDYSTTKVHIDLDSSKNIKSAYYLFGGPGALVDNNKPKILPFNKSVLIEWFGQDRWDRTEINLKRSQKLDQLLIS
jgi:hypothetical protein